MHKAAQERLTVSSFNDVSSSYPLKTVAYAVLLHV